MFELAFVNEFWRLWYSGQFNGQRVGQAFFNYADLHKMTNPPNIYEISDTTEFRAKLAPLIEPNWFVDNTY